MSVLYLDTSYDITIGLLDEGLRWMDLRDFKGQRASSTIQVEAYRLLDNYSTNLKSVTAIVTLAGPGFYTGLRFSEGFADVLKFFNIPHYSFYAHEIPAWLGKEKGTWLTKAYRGEYFCYEWDGVTNKTELLSEKDLPSRKFAGKVFVHSETALDDKLRQVLPATKGETTRLIQSFSADIFKKVITEKMLKESYYFRAPEDEFRTNP